MYDYEPLWTTLSEKGVSTYRLINEYGISKGTLDSLKHNRNVTVNTLDTLCQILEVPIENIVNISIDDISARAEMYNRYSNTYNSDSKSENNPNN